MGPLASHAREFPRVTPLAPRRIAPQATLSREAHAVLRRAQEPLAHAPPESGIAHVLERALHEFVQWLEQRKPGGTDAPWLRNRTFPRGSSGSTIHASA